MPIYEYICQCCGERFERLLLTASNRDAVNCPYCGSEDVERSVSPFLSVSNCPETAKGFG